MNIIRLQAAKIFCVLLVLFTSFSLQARIKHSFTEGYNIKEHEQIIDSVSTLEYSKIPQFLKQYPIIKQIDLLAYIGLHSYNDLNKSQSKLLKGVSHLILRNEQILKLDVDYKFMDQGVKNISPLVRHIVMSPKYEDYLFDLYLSIANKSAPSFWTNYDLFHNIIAWDRKNNKLFKTKIITLQDGKTAVSQVPSDELQLFADYLSKDINEILEKLGIDDPPRLTFVNMKRNKASAWYSARRHTIYINLGSRNISWSALMGEVLWHEIYHVWQHSYIKENLLDDLEANVASFKQDDFAYKERLWLAGIFKANLEAYQQSRNGYQFYKSQPVEAKAFEFGEKIFQSLLR